MYPSYSIASIDLPRFPHFATLIFDAVHDQGSWRNACHACKRLQRDLPHICCGNLSLENYPEEPVHFQPRYRGIHVLHRDESGLEKCVGCFLCAAACPARCIYIEAAENTDVQRISAGERYARVYNIDYSRCIFCGYCVEACPTDAITHGHGFELATTNINSMIYRKEKLLEKAPAAP